MYWFLNEISLDLLNKNQFLFSIMIPVQSLRNWIFNSQVIISNLLSEMIRFQIIQ